MNMNSKQEEHGSIYFIAASYAHQGRAEDGDGARWQQEAESHGDSEGAASSQNLKGWGSKA